jgi:hypothetical protein
MQHATMQHMTVGDMTVGVVLVEEEYFCVPFVLHLPLLSIAVNLYLVPQLPWTNLAFLVLFQSLAVAFYFSFGYHFSMGNNGGWDAYNSCGISIHTKPSVWGADDCNNKERIVKDNIECEDQSGKENN